MSEYLKCAYYGIKYTQTLEQLSLMKTYEEDHNPAGVYVT